MNVLNYIKIYWIALTLFTLAAVTALSLWSPGNLPSVLGSDKHHHIIAYAVLIFPTVLRRPRHWKLIILFFIAYSGVIELAQPLMHRSAEWLDMAANVTGVLCGLLVSELIRKLEFLPQD